MSTRARLRRSKPDMPALTRRRAGNGFSYWDDEGRRVADADTMERIRRLAIPPAWVDVWICPWPNGHIQAMGTDVKGRRQYRYHDDWRTMRDQEKFDRMLELGRALPQLRDRVAEDINADALTKPRVLATAVRLLDLGLFRIGGEEYAEENGSFGLATVLCEHVSVSGSEVTFAYPAKSGQEREHTVVDREVAAVIGALRRRRSGGPELLAYRDGRAWVDVRSSDVSDYLRGLTSVPATAKDFRTWNATVLAATGLALAPLATDTAKEHAKVIRQVICDVAESLGNTPAVCRSSYIDPRVVDRFLAGETIVSSIRRLTSMSPTALRKRHIAAERAVVRMLRSERARAAA